MACRFPDDAIGLSLMSVALVFEADGGRGREGYCWGKLPITIFAIAAKSNTRRGRSTTRSRQRQRPAAKSICDRGPGKVRICGKETTDNSAGQTYSYVLRKAKASALPGHHKATRLPPISPTTIQTMIWSNVGISRLLRQFQRCLHILKLQG